MLLKKELTMFSFLKFVRCISVVCVVALWFCGAVGGQENQTQKHKEKLRLVIPQGHTGDVMSVAFSPDGKTIASAGGGGVKLWDVATGVILRTLDVGGVTPVQFSPDSKMLLTNNESRDSTLWDVATGRQIRTFAKNIEIDNWHWDHVDGKFSSDGRLVICAGRRNAKLWDANTGELLRVFSGHKNSLNSVDVSPDTKTIVTSSEDKTVKLWSVATGQLLHTLTGHTGPSDNVKTVAFSPDGKSVLSDGWETTKWWDVSTGKLLRSFGDNGNHLTSVSFAPDGQSFVAGIHGGLQYRNLTTGKVLNRFTGEVGSVRALAFSPDGKMLLGGSDNNTLSLRDAATGKLLRTFTGQTIVDSVAFSTDGTKLISRSQDKNIRVWDSLTGTVRQSVADRSSVITATAFSVDGKTMFYGDKYNNLICSDIGTNQRVRAFTGHTAEIKSIIVSPNSKVVATGSYGDSFRLWDISSGRALRTLGGFNGNVTSFSPDGRTLLCDGGDASLWDVATGSLKGIIARLNGTIACSPDGRNLLCGTRSGNLKIFDIATGNLVRTLVGNTNSVTSVAYSPNGRTIAVGSAGRIIKIWDVATGNVQLTISSGLGSQRYVAFSPDGKALLSSDWKSINLLDVATGKLLRNFSGHANNVSCIAFSPNGKTVLSSSYDRTIKLWDASNGQLLHSFTGNSGEENSLTYSPDGSTFASGNHDRTIKLWAVATGQPISTFVGHASRVKSVNFSRDGKFLVSGSSDGAIKIWDVERAVVVRNFTANNLDIKSVAFSPDGNGVFSSTGTSIKFWDITGKLRHSLPVPAQCLVFSPDSRTILSNSYDLFDRTFHVWDAATGRLLRTFGENGLGSTFTFCPDGQILLSDGYGGIQVKNASDGQLLRQFQERADRIESFAFSADDKTLMTGHWDGSIKLWEMASGRCLATLYNHGRNWAIVDTEGRYDASGSGEFAGMHWVRDGVQIDLNQFKDGFYEPGLLAKKLGFNKEPLRNVPRLADLKLFPEATIIVVEGGKTATVNLANQDGDIGAVQVFINDKELLADARPTNFDVKAKIATLTVNLDSPLVVPGRENKLRIVTRNGEGTLASRPVEATWTAPGSVEKHEPELYGIIGGVSEYADPKAIKSLRFSAKDARDMATAIRLGAEKLFNTKRVHLQLLTGESKPKSNVPRFAATKDNFKTAFELVARQAKSEDVVVVYLAGHGTTLGLGSSTYCYLTQDAAGTDFIDEKNRAAWTITSEELAEWTKKIPAQKQVLVLDTCAAGAAADDLTKRRDIPGDQIRAMERLKDRVGFHVLMGSSSDAVSYEAGRYNQGLLTYALLEGMKGRALREGKFVDVKTLFSYAQERVPQLAKNIGGIQQPQTASPKGESFDVALVTDSEKKNIPLSIEQPQVLRPIVFDDGTDDNFDTLAFEPLLREALNDAGHHSEQSTIGMVYIDSGALPGALRPLCIYKIVGDAVQVSIIFQRDGQNAGEVLQIVGRKDQLELLAEQVASGIRKSVAGKVIGRTNTDGETSAMGNRSVPAENRQKPLLVSTRPLPQDGEIALRGTVKSVEAKANQLVLTVRAFQLPNGKQSSIAPKDKTILINAQTKWRGIAFGALKIGVSIEVIGTDSGKQLSARFVQNGQ